MQVGDLVRCLTVEGKPVGLVLEKFVFEVKPTNETDIFYVLIPHHEDPFPIRTSQVEVIHASR